MPQGKTFALQLKKRFLAAISASRAVPPLPSAQKGVATPIVADAVHADDGEQQKAEPEFVTAEAPEDVLNTYSKAAIAKVAQDKALLDRIRNNGIPWKGVLDPLQQALPDVLNDRNKIAHGLVPEFMDEIFGQGRWQTERRPSKSSSGTTTWILLKK
jgi:hypothetical protein